MKPGRAIAPVAGSSAASRTSVSPPSGAVAWLQRAVANRLLAGLGDPPIALVVPSGEAICHTSKPPVARIIFGDTRALLGLVGTAPDLRFGDAYVDGRIEIEGDFHAAIEAAFTAPANRGSLQRAAESWRHLMRRRNSLRGSRDNISEHYDLGNDFYALWLDEELVYTCAYFPTPDLTLEEAQRAKLELVSHKLRLRPGETVVEAGCGWGALALHMARRHGVRVRAFNISREQITFARERARAEGLADRVEFIDDDYRSVTGTCDAFVSVGMLEHVGPEHYAELGRVLDRTLSKEGRGLLHFIGRNRPQEFSPFVQRRIFPGAHAPALSEASVVLEEANLSVLDVENLRLHYARTLEHWLSRFEAHRDDVRARFDERFVRTWRLYLAGSIAAFRTGSLQLFQILFARGSSNAVPWTRKHLQGDL